MAIQNQIVEKVELVLCSEIEVDHKFNARSSVEISSLVGKDGADESEHNTQKTLRESIGTVGQETPVVLRRMPKGSKKPYFLVSGFRRFDAVMHTQTEKGNKAPTIKAFIRDMTDQQAREENMRENTARADLSGPDLCYGIGQILKSYGKDKGPSSVALAATLGMSQGYTNQLMNIWNNCLPEIVKDWRESPNRLTAVQMYSISKEDKDKQRAKYDELKAKKDEGGTSSRGPNAWVDTACKSAAALCAVLGKLQRDGALEIVGDNFFGDNIRTLVKFKSDATEAQVDKICAAAEKAFTDAYESEETEEDKDNASKKSPEAKKASAKKKGNGKSASAN